MAIRIDCKRFLEIVSACEEQPNQDLFLAEYGVPKWILKEVTNDEKQAVEIIKKIHHITHIKPRDLIAESGLTQTRFAERFMIPLRTVQNWCGGQRTMPRYEKFMFATILDLLHDIEIINK